MGAGMMCTTDVAVPSTKHEEWTAAATGKDTGLVCVKTGLMAVRTWLMHDTCIGERKSAAGSRDGVELKSEWMMAVVHLLENSWRCIAPAKTPARGRQAAARA